MANSWDQFIDHLIESSRDKSGEAHIDKACIISLEDGAPWTSSSHPNVLVLQGNEGREISTCFKKKDFTYFKSAGVYIEGGYGIFLRESGNSVYARSEGQGGLTLQASSKAIIIARCPRNQRYKHGLMNEAVHKLVGYLTSLDF
uniref:Profilin n=1 Tax=Halisarca dujardinii TaxID=2583056 RepID=A0A9E9GA84_HALDU|nr:profilin 4 [Halisarca dujardinii]